jgi:hypothetical protein
MWLILRRHLSIIQMVARWWSFQNHQSAICSIIFTTIQNHVFDVSKAIVTVEKKQWFGGSFVSLLALWLQLKNLMMHQAIFSINLQQLSPQ